MKRRIKQFSKGVLGLALIASAANAVAQSSIPSPQSMQPPPNLECAQIEAINAAPGDYTIVDARSPSEYDDGHIASAINVPFDSLDLYADVLPADRSAAIVTYCRTGRRAAVLKQLLTEQGYTNISVVPGGQMDTTYTQNPVFRCGEQSD